MKTAQQDPRHLWLQRLQRVLSDVPAVGSVSIAADPRGWRVFVEFDYTDSNLYVALSEVEEMLEPVHSAYDSSSDRCRLRDCTWFDANDWDAEVGVFPYYGMVAEGIDPAVLRRSIESMEQKSI